MRAREAAGFAHADRVADIAINASDEGIDPQAARAAMDGLKWAAERMAPKHHSQRQNLEHSGQIEGGRVEAVEISIVGQETSDTGDEAAS